MSLQQNVNQMLATGAIGARLGKDAYDKRIETEDKINKNIKEIQSVINEGNEYVKETLSEANNRTDVENIFAHDLPNDKKYQELQKKADDLADENYNLSKTNPLAYKAAVKKSGSISGNIVEGSGDPYFAKGEKGLQSPLGNEAEFERFNQLPARTKEDVDFSKLNGANLSQPNPPTAQDANERAAEQIRAKASTSDFMNSVRNKETPKPGNQLLNYKRKTTGHTWKKYRGGVR